MAEPARPIQLSVLPIREREHVGVTTFDAKSSDTSFPPIEPLRPPEGAPNVLAVLINDAEDSDHLITADKRLKIAMARQ